MTPCSTCNGGPYVPPSVPHAGTRLVVWGEMGGAEEAANKRGFVGASGKMLRKALRQAGFHVDSAWPNDRRVSESEENVAFTNTILCRADGNKFPGADAARACLRECQKSLYVSDIHPWMACGANATEALTGFRFPKFLDVRGTFLPVLDRPDKWLVATIHPAFIVRGGGDSNPDGQDGKAQMALYPFLALDAVRATQKPQAWCPEIHFGIPTETPDDSCAIDIEGGYGAPISLVGVSWKPGVVWVMPWGPDTRDYLRRALKCGTPVFHNAAYDIPALEQEGIKLESGWLDTINTAALLNPSVKVGLESQVLTYVPGSVAWKGLINHRLGYQAETPVTRLYERLHTEVLTRLGKPVPHSRFEWFVYYNGLDTGGTRLLVPAHKRELDGQGRAGYYRDIMQPLQEPLLRMGLRGVPVDLERMAHHRRACERIERMAQAILDRASVSMIEDERRALACSVAALEEARSVEKAGHKGAFSRAKELSSLRTKLRTFEQRDGFKGTSTPQRQGLLYGHLGLPEVRHRKTGHLTTDEDSIRGLMLRLSKGTITPTRANVADALRVCRALIATSVWSKWRTGFLSKGESI